MEAQRATSSQMRGIPYYIINLYRQLLKRAKYEYGLAVFDKDKIRGSRAIIEEYFWHYGIADIFECNSISYQSLLDGDSWLYEKAFYEDYIDTNGDVFFFPNIFPFPTRLKGKMIITVHDLIPIKLPAYTNNPTLIDKYKSSIENMIKTQPIVMVDSQATKVDIVECTNIKPDRIHVTYLAHDSSICFPEKNESILSALGIRGPYMLYLAAIDIRKGIDIILEAYHAMQRTFPEIGLVIAGAVDEGYSTLPRQMWELSSSPKVLLVGYVTDDQKRALMSGAELFLFPSKYEGFGLPILEAMACGCPVITSNVSSMPEVAGDAGILIDPYSAEELAHEIERVLGSESLRSELRKRGLAQAAKFSWDKTAEQTEAVFQLAKEGL